MCAILRLSSVVAHVAFDEPDSAAAPAAECMKGVHRTLKTSHIVMMRLFVISSDIWQNGAMHLVRIYDRSVSIWCLCSNKRRARVSRVSIARQLRNTDSHLRIALQSSNESILENARIHSAGTHDIVCTLRDLDVAAACCRMVIYT